LIWKAPLSYRLDHLDSHLRFLVLAAVTRFEQLDFAIIGDPECVAHPHKPVVFACPFQYGAELGGDRLTISWS